MKPEIEAKFLHINIDDMRQSLLGIGAVCEQPMRLMRRTTFHNPYMHDRVGYLRIRDEGHRVTMTYKQYDENSIDGTKEIEIVVSEYEAAVALIEATGVKHTSRQETKRETWRLNEAEIVIDEWPWAPPFIEIEGVSEKHVKELAQSLGLDWESAVFGGAAEMYQAYYPHITRDDFTIINKQWTEIAFAMPLPELLQPNS